MVQEAVLLYNKLISICHLIGERIMTDLNIKNLSYVDNFKHSVVGNFVNFRTRVELVAVNIGALQRLQLS